MATTKKPLNLSIQGLFDIAVWLHDLDSNRKNKHLFYREIYADLLHFYPYGYPNQSHVLC